MNKQFQKKILECYPEFKFSGAYFFFGPKNCMLGGFCAEMARNGIYISEFLYPLFDRSDQLNLNFSHRLPYPEGFIDYDQFSKEDRPAELVKRVAPHIENLKSKMTLNSFYAALHSNPTAFKNEWVNKTYILLLILLDKFSEAQALIEGVLKKEYTGAREQITAECLQVKELLEKDPNEAKRLVMSWGEQMKSNLQLS